MSDAYYDDENYNDGFDEDSYEQGVKLELWKQLLGYALAYRRDVTMLLVCAFAVAVAEIAFPLITRGVIDDVGALGADIDLVFYGVTYFGACLRTQYDMLWLNTIR